VRIADDRNGSAVAILDIPKRLDLDVPLVDNLENLHGAKLLPQGTLRLYTVKRSSFAMG
jgi:hypothetical protein